MNELFSSNYLSSAAKLTSSKNDLFYRHIFTPISDCWSRPIHGHASTNVMVKLESTDHFRKCINMGSYNYLGFGGINPSITEQVKNSIENNGVAHTFVRSGNESDLQSDLETKIAKFLSKEAAVVIGMGFATNTTVIPVLLSDGVDPSNVLVMSDSYNHASIVEGIRLSGAKVKVFKHNNALHLEELLIREVANRDWHKIVIFVEGIYSMEGDFCNLPEIIQVKDKYGAHLYLDEAHSIGAIGNTGRGVTEHFNIETSRVEIMMGTFTKSFGSVGGYVCASQDIINCVRANATSCVYSSGMSPGTLTQAIVTLDILSSGSNKPLKLRENANYFREQLMQKKYPILGDRDSPIIPFLIEDPEKLVAFSRECLAQGVAIVIVGYPATPFLESRARFCISSEHTKPQLDFVLAMINHIAKNLRLRTVESYPKQRIVHNFHPELTIYPKSKLVSDTWVTEKPLFVEAEHDFTNTSFINMHNHPEVVTNAKNVVDVYSCGTCGPRGFYGTLDLHTNLEEKLAQHLGVEKTIVYSFGLVVTSSVVKAFPKPSDFLIYDERVSAPVRSGIVLSKANKLSFEHNNVTSLQDQLDYVKQLDSDATIYVLVEGLYADVGDIVKLPEILTLRKFYNFSIICDDTYGFGTLGENGLGVPDYYSINHSNVDFYIGSFEHAIGSVGGFCAGASDLISYQTLNGSGYCFSASLPAYCTAAVDVALDNIGEYMPDKLSLNMLAGYASAQLASLNQFSRVSVYTSTFTPRFCIYIKDKHGKYDVNLLKKIKHDLLDKHSIRVDVVQHPKQYKMKQADPFIKFCVTSDSELHVIDTFVKFLINQML